MTKRCEFHTLPLRVQRHLSEPHLADGRLAVFTLSDAGQINAICGDEAVFGENVAARVAEILHGIDVHQELRLPLLNLQGLKPLHFELLRDHAQSFVVLSAAANEAAWVGASQQQINDLALLAYRQRSVITALKRSRDMLMRSEADLKRMNAMQELMVGKYSHEFGAPLTAILGQLDVLGTPVDADLARALRRIRQAALHLQSLVQGGLDFAVGSNDSRSERSPVELAGFAEEIRELFASMAEEKSLALQVDAPTTIVMIDPLRLRQLAVNLLSNAIKYSRTGVITLALRFASGTLTLRVADQGVGMSAAQVDALFKSAVRFSPGESGSGLGMMIVHDLCQRLGGTVKVESAPAVGTTITIGLPCVPAVADIRGRPLRVLLIDDDADLREIIAALVSAFGHEVEAVASIEQALVVTIPPDVILVDDQLAEGISGLANAPRLRANVPQASIIGMSATNTRKTETLALEFGCDAFIAKPIRQPVLKTLLDQLGQRP